MSQHNHPDVFENRDQFQLERIILFSDAVFAIAITLMVIEIKVPELEGAERNAHAIGIALAHKIPDFMGFLLGFVIIGMFWINHHKLFSYVTNYDSGLMWRNLHILFWIALMPFTSADQIRYGNFNIAWVLYSLNLFMIALAIYFVYRHIGKPQRKLSPLVKDANYLKYCYARSLTIAGIFLMGALLCIGSHPVLSWVSRFVFFFIFPAIAILNKRYGIKK